MAAVLMVSAIGAWAQTPECTDELKTAKYQEWYDNRKDNQEAAYKAASDFITACPSEPEDGPWGAQVKALKKFKADYEKLKGNNQLADQFQAAVTSKNYADQIRIGKQLAEKNPDNPAIYLLMGGAGLGDHRWTRRYREVIRASRIDWPAPCHRVKTTSSTNASPNRVTSSRR